MKAIAAVCGIAVADFNSSVRQVCSNCPIQQSGDRRRISLLCLNHLICFSHDFSVMIFGANVCFHTQCHRDRDQTDEGRGAKPGNFDGEHLCNLNPVVARECKFLDRHDRSLTQPDWIM
jgi:hypothetical protein